MTTINQASVIVFGHRIPYKSRFQLNRRATTCQG
nr:MAG TPA: hypothetical protein [Caudoviricetes sp.]